jgi:long-subunit acyl-CoA synthetase (AMP-forming)
MPKLVPRLHRSLARYAYFVGRELVREQPDPHRFLVAAAFTHSFGQHILATAMRLGASLCVPRQIDTATRLPDLRDLDPTVLPLVPRVQRSLFNQYQAKDETGPMLGPNAQYVCSSGAEPDVKILGVLKHQGLQIIACYASTEASIVSVTPRDEWRPHYSGKVVEDTEVKLSSDLELLIRSSGVTPGYHDAPQLTAASFDEQGYYRSGDFAEITPNGYLRILGRKRDVLNTPEGSNIYPERIENALEQFPWADQVVILGDQRPFLVALIAVKKSHLPRAMQGDFFDESTDLGLVDNEGFIEPDSHQEIYERIGADIARLNEGLERIEQIVRFALFDRVFETEVYVTAGTGKVRRNRKTTELVYTETLEMLYNGGARDASLVPGVDRRLRPRPRNVKPSDDRR